MQLKTASILALFMGFLATSCGSKSDDPAATSGEPLLATLAPQAGADAAAKFLSTEGAEIGNAVLTDGPNGVLMRVDLEGMTPGWHAIHMHQTGDCSDFKNGFKASKGHINPDRNEHGLLNPAGYERADIPNVYAGQDGRATAAFFNSYVRLTASEEAYATVGGGAILMDQDGFAIIVHASPDDHMTQPIGGAGPRVACAAFTSDD